MWLPPREEAVLTLDFSGFGVFHLWAVNVLLPGEEWEWFWGLRLW